MSVASEITRIQNAKSALKTSIENKGVTVSDSTLLSGYSALVDQIQTGGGGGQAEEVLKNLIERDITSITIPNGTTKIGDNAFSNCIGLTSITIPDSVTSIGREAFSGCDSLPVENYIRYADTVALELTDNTQTTYTLKTRTRFINDSLFYGCRELTSIDIPSSVTSIGKYAFYYCAGLTSITIPDSVTNIDTGAFGACTSLTNINISNGLTSINNEVFASCESLTSITIPDSVTSIGNTVFSRCTSLTSVTIGSGVASIGSSVFYNCSKLTSVTINATTPPTLANANAFTNTNNCPIYVPAESVDAYKGATNWSSLASRIQAIS